MRRVLSVACRVWAVASTPAPTLHTPSAAAYLPRPPLLQRSPGRFPRSWRHGSSACPETSSSREVTCRQSPPVYLPVHVCACVRACVRVCALVCVCVCVCAGSTVRFVSVSRNWLVTCCDMARSHARVCTHQAGSESLHQHELCDAVRVVGRRREGDREVHGEQLEQGLRRG